MHAGRNDVVDFTLEVWIFPCRLKKNNNNKKKNVPSYFFILVLLFEASGKKRDETRNKSC